jgi:tRNA-splicing ligase RtcB
MWTDGVPVEQKALDQLRNVASLPFIFKHVAVMPDVHLGIGATVGSVIPTKGAIIPAAVGVDIGCGMVAVPLQRCSSDGLFRPFHANHLSDDLSDLRSAIEAAVPVGNGPGGSHAALDPDVETAAATMNLDPGLAVIEEHRIPMDRAAAQIGTLGGGNHFIELCTDEGGWVWLMLHSGSRGTGNRIGQHFIELAREDMRRHFINLPDRDLAYLAEGTEHFNDYVAAVSWAQKYALLNRAVMVSRVVEALQLRAGGEAVQCHHNYIGRENHFGENVWVTRKGAVDASEGRLGIIPGSMGQRSYIVRGKGNADSFRSCSHGAGRKMSRTEARRTFTVADLASQTSGVECRKDEGVVDEIPGAYKDLDAVMAAQADLVDVVHTLKAVLTVKG